MYAARYRQDAWHDMAHPEAPARRQRYARSSTTTSVAQLLSDSCTSLLQKLTTKVRGPSEAATRKESGNSSFNPLTTSKSTTSIGKSAIHGLGATRTRLEDKYSNVLEKIYGRRRDPERTIEPSLGRSVVLAEKAYPYVSNNVREKTPYRSDRIGHHYRKQYAMEPPYAYLDQESAASRLRHRSNHSELRPRRASKPSKSELSERSFNLYPVEIPLAEGNPVPVHGRLGDGAGDDDATPVPDAVTEREAKRKEIQSLIMKYSALDEVYNRGASGLTAVAKQSAAPVKRYHPAAMRMVAVVSKRRV